MTHPRTALRVLWPACCALLFAGSASAGPPDRLTRLAGPIRPADRDRLAAAGAEVLEALGSDGWLIRLPVGAALPVGLDARSAPWPQAAKLSPEVRGWLDGQALPGGPVTLRAVTFRGRPVAGPAAAVRDLVATKARFEAVEDASDRGYLWLRVAPDRLVETAERLAAHPDVLWVERQLPLEFTNDNSSWLIQSGKEEEGRTVFRQGLTGWGQIVGIADSGLDADACQFRYGPERDQVTLATAAFQPPAAQVMAPANKVISYYELNHANAYDDASGGFHGTHTVGDVAGDNYANLATTSAAGHDAQDGMAPGAQIVFQDIGADDGTLMGLSGVSMYDLLLQAYDTGARVHNNSYGSAILSVAYDIDSASIDQATWELNDLLVVFAAGNSGAGDQGNLQTKSLGGTGSTAKNTLVVGGSGPVELDFYGSTFRLQDDLLFFSSQGPTADSRLKPDLVAPGMVYSATSDPATAVDLGCCDTYNNHKLASNNDDDNCNVDTNSPAFGTSFSSPIATGAAALVRQYYTDGFWLGGAADPQAGFAPTNALLKATLIAGARPLTGVIIGMGTQSELSQPPSFEQGWGRVHLEDALRFAGDTRTTLVLDDVPNPAPGNPMFGAPLAAFAQGSDPIVTDEQRTWFLPAARADGVLKVVLAWSDPAAAPGAELTLVNDLDLEVSAPNSDSYLGNKEYDGFGYSQPSWLGKHDTNNNVEVVSLQAPQTGWYRVQVTGRAIAGNGQAGSDAQGYALVAAGEFEAPLPLSIEPASAHPGETLEAVQLKGEFFVPGMQLELGAGVTVEDLQVSDPRTATIGRLSVAPDATVGGRDATLTAQRVLVGHGQSLFQVAGQGCSCAVPGDPRPVGGLLATMALALWIARRRRRGR